MSVINSFHRPSCLCSRERSMYDSADRHFQTESKWFKIIRHSVFCNLTLKDNSGGFYVKKKKKLWPPYLNSLKGGIISITARLDIVVWLLYWLLWNIPFALKVTGKVKRCTHIMCIWWYSNLCTSYQVQ